MPVTTDDDTLKSAYVGAVFSLAEANVRLLDLADQICATNTGSPAYDSWGVGVYAELLRYLAAELLRHLARLGLVTVATNDGKSVTGDPLP